MNEPILTESIGEHVIYLHEVPEGYRLTVVGEVKENKIITALEAARDEFFYLCSKVTSWEFGSMHYAA